MKCSDDDRQGANALTSALCLTPQCSSRLRRRDRGVGACRQTSCHGRRLDCLCQRLSSTEHKAPNTNGHPPPDTASTFVERNEGRSWSQHDQNRWIRGNWRNIWTMWMIPERYNLLRRPQSQNENAMIDLKFKKYILHLRHAQICHFIV